MGQSSNPDIDYKWNEKYQYLLSLPALTPFDASDRNQKIDKLTKEFGITYDELSGTIYLRWYIPKNKDDLVQVSLKIEEVNTDTTPHTACDSCGAPYHEKDLKPIEVFTLYPKDSKDPVEHTKMAMMCYDCWCPQ